jgi:hypothetical protein
MGGWRYEWVDTLPVTVHEVLIDMLQREQAARERATDFDD